MVFFSILGIVGINATSKLITIKDKVTNVMGWSLVSIGAFILTVGLFGPWFEKNIVHELWNNAISLFGGNLAEIEKAAHLHQATPFMAFAPWLLFILIGVVVILYFFNKRRVKLKK